MARSAGPDLQAQAVSMLWVVKLVLCTVGAEVDGAVSDTAPCIVGDAHREIVSINEGD